MKITVWLLSRERDTWITGAESLGLLIVILTAPGAFIRLTGVLLLMHVSYKALTSLPLGKVPRRPEGSKAIRRNQDLRSRVVGFLNEIRRAEDVVHQAEVGRRSRSDFEKDIAWARKRMMAAAAEVVKATGRAPKVDTASLGKTEDDLGPMTRRLRSDPARSAPEPRSLWDTPPDPPVRRGRGAHP